MDPLTIIIIGLLVVFLAGMIQGLTGFGFALVSVPLLLIFLPPTMAIPMVIIHGTLITLILLFESRKWLELRRILPLIIAGVIGVPFGTYILTALGINVLKVFIGVVITLFALIFLAGFRREIRNEKLASGPIGFISGLLNSSTGMSGPPVILFFINQGLRKEVFRANIIAYFVALNLVTISSFLYTGLITSDVLHYAVLFLPAMILGAATGIRLIHRVDEKLFSRIALIIAAIAGLASILSGLGTI
jgi:hypothetical protein